MKPVDIVHLARECTDSIRPLANAGRVALAVDVPDELPSVDAEPDHVRLFSLLLENAIAFARRGDQVSLTMREAGDVVPVTIADDGEGIDADQLPHVFDASYDGTLAARFRHDGLSAPLATARAIVEAHEGRIWIESASGIGTRIRVALPLPE